MSACHCLHVAADSCVDRALVQRLDRPGQRDIAAGRRRVDFATCTVGGPVPGLSTSAPARAMSRAAAGTLISSSPASTTVDPIAIAIMRCVEAGFTGGRGADVDVMRALIG